MIKVYQRINHPRRGDCFKCVICSLLELDYDSVPNFIELEGEGTWWTAAQAVFAEHGYSLGDKYLYNPRVLFLENPTINLYKKVWPVESETLGSLTDDDGIDGLFMASVYSPKYTTPDEHPASHLHCVICDKDFNIVFDPQKEYEKVVNYPYSRLIEYNGIRGVDTIRKIK